MDKNKILDFSYNFVLMLFGNFIHAMVFVLLQLPTNINTGGSSGVAQVLSPLTGIDTSLMVLIVSGLTFLLGVFYLDKKALLGALAGTLTAPFFIKTWQILGSYIFINTIDLLTISTFIGIFTGIGTAFTLKSGFGAYGITILGQVAYEIKRVSITTTNLIINSIIILAGGYYNGLEVVIFAIYILYISKIVADKVLLGISKNKQLFIITKKEKEIKEYIKDTLKLDLSTLNIKSTSFGNSEKLILTVINTSDYYLLSNGIREIDKNAYFVATDTYQTSNN